MRKSDSFSSSPEIKQFLSDVRKISRENKDMEVAPLRTLDDFILTKSRFQVCNIDEIYFLNCINPLISIFYRFLTSTMKIVGLIGLSTIFCITRQITFCQLS